MIDNGKSKSKMDDVGVPLFQETSISGTGATLEVPDISMCVGSVKRNIPSKYSFMWHSTFSPKHVFMDVNGTLATLVLKKVYLARYQAKNYSWATDNDWLVVPCCSRTKSIDHEGQNQQSWRFATRLCLVVRMPTILRCIYIYVYI